MNEKHLKIIEKATVFVKKMYEKGSSTFVYHNFIHTKQVVEAAEKIANNYELKDSEYFILIFSAWFHDVGFITEKTEGHEIQSARFAVNFLLEHAVSSEIIMRISSCIQATTSSIYPVNFTEEILCDADLFHLGTDKFKQRSKLLKKEEEAYHQIKISKQKWTEKNIHFLQSHKYFTSYCRKILEQKKQKTILQLKMTL